jgi:hypothetical protein
MDKNIHARFDLGRSVGNMSSMCLKWMGQFNQTGIFSVTMSDVLRKFDYAKFLFMFIPVWESMKEYDERKEHARKSV